jgi:feruloyl esterase
MRQRAARLAIVLLAVLVGGMIFPSASHAATDSVLHGLHGWPSSASPQPAALPTDAAGRCKAMVGDFADIEDAPSQVVAAKIIDAADDVPAFCQVKGYSSPHIGFELELPTESWNGKFLYHGCFGICGVIFTVACNEALSQGYACVLGDMGHSASASDGKWAYDDLQAKFDFAIRSTHVTTLVGKALAALYYGKPPAKSYFLGCSGGGRQAMLEAESFPWDFDGIVAGAPGIGDHMTLTWGVASLLDKDGKALLSPDDTALISKAAIEKCGGDDGAKDGLITDPRTCKFDPGVLLCKGAHDGTCLAQAQVDGLKAFYKGAFTSAGQRITHGAALPGSEANWPATYTPARDGNWSTLTLTTDFWRYMSFFPDPGPHWSLSQLDWDKDPKRLGAWQTMMAATNPNLTRFKDAGGKLIMYKGWADEFSPEIPIDYYEMAERTMGGRAATQSFLRLFMVPGMGHCFGGKGGGELGWLSYLENWVEKNQAPDKVIVYPAPSRYFPGQPDYYPVKPNPAPDRAWPVYPYPLNIRYKGSGDPKDPASFLPVEPKKP